MTLVTRGSSVRSVTKVSTPRTKMRQRSCAPSATLLARELALKQESKVYCASVNALFVNPVLISGEIWGILTHKLS